MTRFYGKYRGLVVSNADPLKRARLRVLVPSVLGETIGWALPCVPFAGPGVGFLALPPVDANVWVEFEAGDLDHPIWSGCFWGEGEVPAEAMDAAGVWRTTGAAIVLGRRAPGADALAIASPTPLEVQVNDDRVVIGRKDKPLATIRDDSVELNIAPLALTLSASEQQLKLTSGATTVTIAAGSIELQNGSTSVRLGAEQIMVRGMAIDLTTGGGRIEITPASVSINNGALEVT